MVMRTLVTAEQFYETPDDNLRHDLIEGEVWTMSLPGGRHGDIAMRLGYRLYAHVDAHALGKVAAAETGFVLARDPDTVVGPDLAFVRAARVPSEGVPEKHWPLAPDLAVEIYLPGDRPGAMAKKAAAYLHGGTRLLWVIYPEKRQVVVHQPSAVARTLTGDDMLEGGEVVPGFACPLRALWD